MKKSRPRQCQDRMACEEIVTLTTGYKQIVEDCTYKLLYSPLHHNYALQKTETPLFSEEKGTEFYIIARLSSLRFNPKTVSDIKKNCQVYCSSDSTYYNEKAVSPSPESCFLSHYYRQVRGARRRRKQIRKILLIWLPKELAALAVVYYEVY